jgi:hypothetical protein
MHCTLPSASFLAKIALSGGDFTRCGRRGIRGGRSPGALRPRSPRHGSRTCCIGITRSQILQGSARSDHHDRDVTTRPEPPDEPDNQPGLARAQRRERLVEQKDAR